MLKFWDPDALPFAIDWSAWATFIAGIAAVIGAVAVGRRQADIASKQASIADRQAQIMERQTAISASVAETEAARFRSELYDRRVALYATIERFWARASNFPLPVAADGIEEMYQAISQARFLLDNDVEEIADNIVTTAIGLRGVYARLQLEGDDAVRRAELDDELARLNERMRDLYSDLILTKEHYLRLSKPPQTLA